MYRNDFNMKKLLFVIFLLMLLGAGKGFAEEHPYESWIEKFVNHESKRFTLTEVLETKKTDKLSAKSKAIHQKALEVYRRPYDQKTKISYLKEFPEEFDTFLKVFHIPNFDQLYDGYIYIRLFGLLSLEYPNISIHKILSLLKDACFDGDAPAHFQRVVESFKEQHPDIFSSELMKLDDKSKRHISIFLMANIRHESHESDIVNCRK